MALYGRGFKPVHTFDGMDVDTEKKFFDVMAGWSEGFKEDAPPEVIQAGYERIQRLEGEGLIQFAQHIESGEPALFIAPRASFKSDEDFAAAERMVKYFDRGGNFDARTGELVGEPTPNRMIGDKLSTGLDVTVVQWFEKSGEELKALQAEMKMSRHALKGLLEGLEARGQLKLRLVSDGIEAHRTPSREYSLSQREREVCAAIKRLFGLTFEDGRVKLDEYVGGDRPGEHTYMKAIETQYAALSDLATAIQREHAKRAAGLPMQMIGTVKAVENYSIDYQILKRSETYCWFKDQTEAVVSAGITLPGSVRLDRDLTPVRAGWWYFVNPLNIKTTEGIDGNDDHVMALSWSWAVINEQNDGLGTIISLEGTGRTGVIMAAYIWADGRPVPSTQFFWSEGQSLERMITETRASLTRNFSDPNYRDGQAALARLPMTMQAVEQMARFFAAGNLWIQQKILVQQSRAMERHARKRFEKEGKTAHRPLSDVQIIQLRRREVVALEKTKPGAGAVDWKCQWIVGGTTGFWRNQWYATKGYHIPIHIDPFIKGPADRPLKVPTHRVYAVNR